MKEKITEQLKGAGIGTLAMHGIHCIIDYLSDLIGKDESILTAALSYYNAIPGVFIVTNERVLFLGRKNYEDQFHTISINFGEIIFVDHKKVKSANNTELFSTPHKHFQFFAALHSLHFYFFRPLCRRSIRCVPLKIENVCKSHHTLP